jgi:hypothetical protein
MLYIYVTVALPWSVTLPDLLVVGDVTRWYQSHGFDTTPGWAMLVVNETNISE